MRKNTKQEKRYRRHMRSRVRITGTAKCPRISVFRSLRGMYIQLVDDEHGNTIVSVNAKKDVDTKLDAQGRKGKVAVAYLLGKALAEKAKEKKIEDVIFDRGGNRFHGRVKALAEGARDGGLKF